MNADTPLAWGRDRAVSTALQSWSWALAVVLALLACAAVFWWRRRAGSQARRRVDAPVRRLGGARLSPRVALKSSSLAASASCCLSASPAPARSRARRPMRARRGAGDEARLPWPDRGDAGSALVWLAPWQAMAAGAAGASSGMGDLAGVDAPATASALRIAIGLTALSLLPALLVCTTAFLRIIIVLSMLRHGWHAGNAAQRRAAGPGPVPDAVRDVAGHE